MATTETSTLSTPHATLSYTISTPPDPANSLSRPFIVLIHGNSTHSAIFRPVLESRIASNFPILTVDLPGHGKSSNSPTPDTTYTQPGYAKAIGYLLSMLKLPQVMILGWSLGGHIAMEMLALPQDEVTSRILGIMLVGTPPVAVADIPKGFYIAENREGHDPKSKNMAATKDLSEEELDLYAKIMTFRYEPWLRDAVGRTDGFARSNMWTRWEDGEASDQRAFVKDTKVLTAVVNGADEPFVDLGYIRGLEYGNLWEGKCHEIEGLGHAPFWEDWAKFEGIMERWASDCEAEGKGT